MLYRVLEWGVGDEVVRAVALGEMFMGLRVLMWLFLAGFYIQRVSCFGMGLLHNVVQHARSVKAQNPTYCMNMLFVLQT